MAKTKWQESGPRAASYTVLGISSNTSQCRRQPTKSLKKQRGSPKGRHGSLVTERLQCESNSHQGGWSHVGGPLDLTFLLIILQRGKRKYRLLTKREAKKTERSTLRKVTKKVHKTKQSKETKERNKKKEMLYSSQWSLDPVMDRATTGYSAPPRTQQYRPPLQCQFLEKLQLPDAKPQDRQDRTTKHK